MQSFFASPTVRVSVDEDVVFLNPLEGDFPVSRVSEAEPRTSPEPAAERNITDSISSITVHRLKIRNCAGTSC